MAESFGLVMGQRLLFWSGWFFTVFGVLVGLYLSKEYAWIGILIAVGGLLPLGTHAGWVHKRLAEAEQEHGRELGDAKQQHREEVRRRELAEQRLAEVPAAAIARLATLVSEGAADELLGLLVQQAGLVGRLQKFMATATKPLIVRSFQRLQGELYVMVRGVPEALSHLRPGDAFVLVRRNEAGVEIDAARLAVHQPLLIGADVVVFRVVVAIADDIVHLSGLAGERAIEGIKGYGLNVALDLTGTPSLDFAQVAQALPHLAAGLARK